MRSTHRKHIARRPRVVIRRKHYVLPAGLHAVTGKLASLRAVLSRRTPTRDFEMLPEPEQARVTAARIAAQKAFSIGVPGVGVIDKQRALREVQEGTAIGKALINVEMLTLRTLKEEAAARLRARRLPQKTRTRRKGNKR
jgi:hypothetical protein